jgi:hypothetical protein
MNEPEIPEMPEFLKEIKEKCAVNIIINSAMKKYAKFKLQPWQQKILEDYNTKDAEIASEYFLRLSADSKIEGICFR